MIGANDATAGRRLVRVETASTVDRALELDDREAVEDRLRQEAKRVGTAGAWLIAWLDYAVLVGRVADGAVVTRQPVDPRYLQELRLFAEAGEWRLWRAGSGFAARRRLDGAGEPVDVLEDDQSMWGTTADATADRWTRLSESRGIAYDLPAPVADADLPLRLRLRHYLASDADGVVGVADSRLVAICDHRGVPLKEQEGARA